MTVRNWQRRVGLTLIELVVVLVILAILAALVIPRMGNIRGQANAATAVSALNEVSTAASLYESRYGKAPTGSDGLLINNTSSTFYGRTGTDYGVFHPNIQTGGPSASSNVLMPILYPVTLTDIQAKSLNDAGITSCHYNDDSTGKNATKLPSDSGVNWGSVASGKNVAGLFIPTKTTTPAWTSHGSTFPDRAFNINPFNSGASDTFVVFGVGQPCGLRGATLVDAPIVQSADPTQYYARVFIVYHIPGPTATTSFPAQFVGSFSPDGTSTNDNVRNYSATDKPL